MAIIKHPNSFYELSDYIEHVEKVGNKAEERTYLRLKLKYIYGVNPDNLISLCGNCHAQTNYDRNDWINYFNRKVM